MRRVAPPPSRAPPLTRSPRPAGDLGFDHFIRLCVELQILTRHFAARDTTRTGRATFNYEDFLTAVFSIKA